MEIINNENYVDYARTAAPGVEIIHPLSVPARLVIGSKPRSTDNTNGPRSVLISKTHSHILILFGVGVGIYLCVYLCVYVCMCV